MSWNPYYEQWAAVHGPEYAWSVRQCGQACSAGRAADRDVRVALIRRYAFAVPGEEALATIARHGPVVEIGAGTGYWARCLRERGVDVVAYDELGDQWLAWFRSSPDGGRPALWTEVARGAPVDLAAHPDRSLLLCWADPWSGMDEAALRAYQGEVLLLVGESGEGGPGTPGFRRLLDMAWQPVEQVAIPQWDGCDDRLAVYRRS